VAKNNKPLKVALHGMDSRAIKIMMLFLQGPCGGAAYVVNAEDADVDIFDGDGADSKDSITKHLQENTLRPVIVLSLWDFVQEGVLHVAKPASTSDMLMALERAKALVGMLSKKAARTGRPSSLQIVDKVEPENLHYTSEKLRRSLIPQSIVEDTLLDVDDWFESSLK
jgi:hypothetical protein